MQETFSNELYTSLQIADELFTELSMERGTSTPGHSEVLREALRPLDLLHKDVAEPNGLAVRTCLRIRDLRQETIE